MIMLQPGGELWRWEAAALLASTVLLGVTRIWTRVLAATDTPQAIAFALMAALERRATELTVEVRDDEEANLKALLAGGPTRPNTRRLSRNAGDDADGWAWTWVSGADLTRHVEWVIKEHIGLWNPQAAPTSHYNLARRLVRDIAAHFNIFLY
jgi:hypothetical protein